MANYGSRQPSPLRRNNSVLSMNSNSVIGDTKNKLINRLQIENLLQKFNDVNGSIEIEADQTNFNLIQYERQNDKIKYDPQMMTAKLRKLQNKAQINRAQMEIDNRLKRKMRKIENKTNVDQQSYQTIYNKYIKNRKLSQKYDDGSDDDQSHPNQNQPKEVAYFSQLKRHPKLLEYTIKMINNRTMADGRDINKLKQVMEKHKNEKVEISEDYKQLLELVNKKNSQKEQYNPQSVIDEQFSKFFNKKSSDSLLKKQVVHMPRCSRMIAKQNEILSHLDEKSLSKDNKKKLKNKLNQIICSIGKNQRSSQIKKNHHKQQNQQNNHTSPMTTQNNHNGKYFTSNQTGRNFALPKIYTTAVIRNQKSLLSNKIKHK